MGNGYKLAAVTRIKGTFLQTITSQDEEAKCGAEKESAFLSKKITILLVISGLKMSAQDAFAHVDLCTLWPRACMWAHSCLWQSVSPKQRPYHQVSPLRYNESHLIWRARQKSPKAMTWQHLPSQLLQKKTNYNDRSSDLHFFLTIIVQWCIFQIYWLIIFASAIRQWQTLTNPSQWSMSIRFET